MGFLDCWMVGSRDSQASGRGGHKSVPVDGGAGADRASHCKWTEMGGNGGERDD